jgi:hypothetical protein
VNRVCRGETSKHESFTFENAHVAVSNVMTRSCSRISWSTTERIWASEQFIVAVSTGLTSAFSWQTSDNEDMVNVRFGELTPSQRIVEAVDFVTYRLLALHKHK